ncbi:hypothetical protein LCGC14_0721550 [marine sediment metagenome]|uniref:Uncharacterized protein n=1 Tax=marine sediment metagenome TaxID=412755 RepID=A0A0F9QXA7_9ZZZZ
MTVQNMISRTLGRKPGYHHTEQLLDGVTGDPVIIPPLNGQPVTCSMIITGVSGKFQTTTSTDALVAAGTAVWEDWPEGTVTVNTDDRLLSPVTAVRGVSVSGVVDINIVM